VGLGVGSLALELGRALAPLERRLRAGQVRLLFAELGLPAPALAGPRTLQKAMA